MGPSLKFRESILKNKRDGWFSYHITVPHGFPYTLNSKQATCHKACKLLVADRGGHIKSPGYRVCRSVVGFWKVCRADFDIKVTGRQHLFFSLF